MGFLSLKINALKNLNEECKDLNSCNKEKSAIKDTPNSVEDMFLIKIAPMEKVVNICIRTVRKSQKGTN